MLQGAEKRERLAWRMNAFVAANIMNVWIKKGHSVTIDKLLPGLAERPRLTADQTFDVVWAAHLAELKAKMDG